MHIDEIKAWEADQAEMVEEIEANPFEILTTIAIEEAKKKKSVSDVFHRAIVEERQMDSMTNVLHAMSGQGRQSAPASIDDAFHQMTKERKVKEGEKVSFMDMVHKKIVEERQQPNMVDAFNAMSLQRR